MTSFVALLRAVNVGGTGKLPMGDLKEFCEELGFGADTLVGVRGQRDEQIRLGRREIHIHYGQGMASSKLVIAAAKSGTARNMNAVATLARMAAES